MDSKTYIFLAKITGSQHRKDLYGHYALNPDGFFSFAEHYFSTFKANVLSVIMQHCDHQRDGDCGLWCFFTLDRKISIPSEVSGECTPLTGDIIKYHFFKEHPFIHPLPTFLYVKYIAREEEGVPETIGIWRHSIKDKWEDVPIVEAPETSFHLDDIPNCPEAEFREIIAEKGNEWFKTAPTTTVLCVPLKPEEVKPKDHTPTIITSRENIDIRII